MVYLNGELEVNLVTDVCRSGILEGAGFRRRVSHIITEDIEIAIAGSRGRIKESNLCLFSIYEMNKYMMINLERRLTGCLGRSVSRLSELVPDQPYDSFDHELLTNALA